MNFFGNFLVKKLLDAKLKNIPQSEREKVQKALEEHPEIFERILKDIEQQMKSGKNQFDAVQDVLRKNQTELQNIFNRTNE